MTLQDCIRLLLKEFDINFSDSMMRFFIISALLALTFLLLPAIAQQSLYVGGEFGKAWLNSSGNAAGDLWTWGSPPKYYYDYYPYYYTGYGGYGYYGGWLPYIALYPQDFYSPNFVYYPWDDRRFSSISISGPPGY